MIPFGGIKHLLLWANHRQPCIIMKVITSLCVLAFCCNNAVLSTCFMISIITLAGAPAASAALSTFNDTDFLWGVMAFIWQLMARVFRMNVISIIPLFQIPHSHCSILGGKKDTRPRWMLLCFVFILSISALPASGRSPALFWRLCSMSNYHTWLERYWKWHVGISESGSSKKTTFKPSNASWSP